MQDSCADPKAQIDESVLQAADIDQVGGGGLSTSDASDRLQITLPDPDDERLFHVFSVDPDIVRFLCSVLETEHIAAKGLGWKAFARALLVQEGMLIRADDAHYCPPDDAGLPR
jgi:hypothetical protein